jgi:hypothetical protein
MQRRKKVGWQRTPQTRLRASREGVLHLLRGEVSLPELASSWNATMVSPTALAARNRPLDPHQCSGAWPPASIPIQSRAVLEPAIRRDRQFPRRCCRRQRRSATGVRTCLAGRAPFCRRWRREGSLAWPVCRQAQKRWHSRHLRRRSKARGFLAGRIQRLANMWKAERAPLAGLVA